MPGRSSTTPGPARRSRCSTAASTTPMPISAAASVPTTRSSVATTTSTTTPIRWTISGTAPTSPASSPANQPSRAAGNDGPGEGTVSSPANAPDVLAVGASISGVQVPSIALASPISRPVHSIRYDGSANPPTTPTLLPVVDVGAGDEEGYAGKDVT